MRVNQAERTKPPTPCTANRTLEAASVLMQAWGNPLMWCWKFYLDSLGKRSKCIIRGFLTHNYNILALKVIGFCRTEPLRQEHLTSGWSSSLVTWYTSLFTITLTDKGRSFIYRGEAFLYKCDFQTNVELLGHDSEFDFQISSLKWCTLILYSPFMNSLLSLF